MNEQTYTTSVNFSNGPWMGADNPKTQPAGYIDGVPPRIIGDDSFELVVHAYEDALASPTALDLSTASASLYVAADVDGASRSAIGTGVISGAENNVTTFTVDSSSIPAALYGITAILICEWTSGTLQRSAYQRVEINHYSAGIGSTPAAGAMAYSPHDSADWLGTAPDDVAEALDDLSARLGPEQTLVGDITLTYTVNDPAITPDGTVTIADGSAPTNAELLIYCEELQAKVEALLDIVETANLMSNA